MTYIKTNATHGRRLLLERDIKMAQLHTRSNAEAARYLNVSFVKYKRFAKMYGLYDQHINQGGHGGKKHKMNGAVGLDVILNNERPHYDKGRLRERLIAAGKLKQACGLCGFDECRVFDGRCPLILHMLDGNDENYHLENLQLRCYNCSYLTTGKVNLKPILPAEIIDKDMFDSGEITLDDIQRMQDEVRQELTDPDDE